MLLRVVSVSNIRYWSIQQILSRIENIEFCVKNTAFAGVIFLTLYRRRLLAASYGEHSPWTHACEYCIHPIQNRRQNEIFMVKS